MIDHLQGTLRSRQGNRIVLNVGGMGCEITLTLTAQSGLPGIGETLEVCTHLAVRDDALQLFGFADNSERELFHRLTSISGIGPKLALGVLSAINAAELASAVEGGDRQRLAQLPGIGKKTAGRLLLELTGKMPSTEGDTSLISDACAALQQLGIKSDRAREMVRKVQDQHDNLEELVRAALKGES